MKTIVKPDEVVRLFADQTQSYASNSNKSLFFKNDKIYSWGEHFCIARMLDYKTVLFTEKTYSVSTSKHISLVHGGTMGFNKIYCKDPDGTHEDNFSHWQEKAKDLSQKLLKARKPVIYLDRLKKLGEDVSKYAEFANVPIPAYILEVLETSTVIEKPIKTNITIKSFNKMMESLKNVKNK